MKRFEDSTVLIVGLGQIGGSIGLELVRRRLAAMVVGYDADSGAATAAREIEAIDSTVSDLESAAAKADLVVLAPPVGVIPELLGRLAAVVGPDTLVLDVGSSKGRIMAAAERIGGGFPFVGGHPIAGTEGSGIQAAEEGKFVGHGFVLTPREDGREEWLQRAVELVRILGAVPLIMKADDHDRALALTSHLPYALAVMLMKLLAEREKSHPGLHRLAGGSFRSATRVAESAPELTLDMFLANGEAVDGAIGALVEELSGLREAIRSGDRELLLSLIESARDRREELG